MKSKNLHVGPWAPAIALALLIFVLSSVPGTAYPRTDVPDADKMVHAALYGTLGALCARGLVLGGRQPHNTVRRALTIIAIATVLATLYGVTDELHQLLVPARSSDWRDVVADAVGALAGGTLGAFFWRRRRLSC